MKNIDENFFKMTEENKITSVNDLLLPKEKVLWKGKPKKFGYIMSKSIGMMPVALLWGAIDFSIIFSLLSQDGFTEGIGFFAIFLIGFFALHLMPVWIWLGSIIKASKEMATLEYVITNRRIIELRGKKHIYIQTEIDIVNISNISLKIGFIDKILKVGDIYLTGNGRKSIVLFDIPNSEFITRKLEELTSMPSNTKKSEFYSNNHECSHCGTYYDAGKHKCPSCGAPTDK